MKSIISSVVISSSVLTSLCAQDINKADPNIRQEGEVVLKFEERIKIPEIERFKDGVLKLFPGDKVHLKFQKRKNGKLGKPKLVAQVKHPKRTITFNMTQDETITMLFRETDMQETVGLDCEYIALGSKEFIKTNLMPTEKGLMVGDSWSNSVYMFLLSNIEVSSKSASEFNQEKIQGTE